MQIVFAGMIDMVNTFRSEELDLPPIRIGDHGGNLPWVHKVSAALSMPVMLLRCWTWGSSPPYFQPQ